jgi:methyl-coenzyme M reductase subunit C
MFGRDTQCVDCRESMGLGRGGGLAQRGTLSETGRADVIAVAMSPGRRHITKPVCEITYGLRREGIQVSVLVLNSGAGVPEDLTGHSTMGYGPKFGLSPKELAQIERHKLLILHLGNVDSHVINKAKEVLRFVDIPTIVACQNPIDFEQFAEAGIKTRLVKPRPENIQTRGTVMEIVSGITRGETCSRENLNKIVKYVKTINPQNN